MGDGKKQALRVSFDRGLRLEFHGANITSDAGLLVYRELDDALELTTRSGGLLDDWRTGKNTQHSLVALLRQSIFSRLAGYEDTNDAERLAIGENTSIDVGMQSKTACRLLITLYPKYSRVLNDTKPTVSLTTNERCVYCRFATPVVVGRMRQD